MPTVFKQAGFQVRIHSDDHPPAHVHVWKAGDEIVIDLGADNVPPSIRENKTMRRSDARRAVLLVEDNQEVLLEEWRAMHGQVENE